ncbi:NACHT domain-containing protein [Argonema galeatum]|uniref:NACHT domain-containing protein n=1 Tax=Argonema galeatum TaxID=2942762 RepID=UPI0020126310|nr:NACHT domain-containing NTPase [Argonema galeatum]MCL1465588.1 NACHT domain-containing NTPase [Argonema galeatum A003/A1]
MTNRGIKASPEGIEKAETALSPNNLNKKVLAEELGLARSTVTNFFRGIAVDRINFEEICKKLGLDWRDIVAKPPNEHDPQVVQEANSSLASEDVDALVRELRQLCYNKIQHRCGTIRLLDVNRPIKLSRLYVDVNVMEDIPSLQRKEISDLQQHFKPHTDDFNRFGLGKPQKRLPGLEAVATYSKLMVLGKPGSGKSTFLQHLAIECNQGNFQPDRIPVFIQLNNFAKDARASGDFNLVKYISQEFRKCGISELNTETLLNHGKVLVLLDGLDEVQDADSDRVIESLRNFSDDYYNNQLIITCRIAAQYKFQGFTDVETADFNQTQIQTFVKNWFVAVASNFSEEAEAKATQFINQLQMPENHQIREIACTPLLLHLTCLFFREKAKFPSNRAKLYDEGLDLLLKKWDEERGIKRDEIYRNLSIPYKKLLLTHVAAITFEQGDYFFEKDKIQQHIADYLRTLSDVETDSTQLQMDSEAVLKSIEAQHGLLVERARRIYSFSHLTFQEYFTAKKIVTNSEPQALENLVRNITDKRWREVFFLVAGMLGNADQLLRLIKQGVDTLLASDDELQEFLMWIDQKTISVQVSYKQVAVRAFYFALTFDPSFAHVLDISLDLDDALIHAHSLANAFVFYNEFDFSFDHDNAFNADFDEDLAFAYSDAQALDFALNPFFARNRAWCHAYNYELDLHFTLEPDLAIEPELEKILQQLYDQLPQPYSQEAMFKQWWRDNGWNVTTQLTKLMNKHCNIGRDWQLNEQQKGLLKQYYDANRLLVECLNSGCEVTPEVRHEIEDTLLLPIAEIERRKSEV